MTNLLLQIQGDCSSSCDYICLVTAADAHPVFLKSVIGNEERVTELLLDTRILLKKIYFIILAYVHLCVSVWVHVTCLGALRGQQKAWDFGGLGLQFSCLTWVLRLNLDLLEEQLVPGMLRLGMQSPGIQSPGMLGAGPWDAGSLIDVYISYITLILKHNSEGNILLQCYS